MSHPEPVTAAPAVSEPTLAAELTRAVRMAVPTRLYQLLHLAFPPSSELTLRLARIGRAIAGTIAATWVGLLFLELFLRILGSPPGTRPSPRHTR